MSVTKETLLEDLGSEPEANRGVALKDPVADLRSVPEVEEEPKEEVAEGQTEEPVEEQETLEEIQAEGQEPLYFNDFVKSAGWDLEEGYRDLYVKDKDGNQVALGEALDASGELRAENESLRQERQQWEEKAKVEQTPVQTYSPKAVQLANDADYLQRAYDTYAADGTFDKMDASEAVKLKLDYRDKIEVLRREATIEQQKYAGEMEGKAREAIVQIDAQMRKDIKEWNSPNVRQQETSAIADYMRSNGAEQQTIDQVLKYNPWAAKMFRRLWQLERSQAEVKKGVREVKRVPKSIKPSARVASKPDASPASVGKKLQAATGRRAWDKILATEDLGVAPD